MRLGRDTITGRAALERRAVQILDVLADPEYDYGEGQKVGGYRTLLGVPMLREGLPIGVIVLSRAEVQPFTARQVELVETFADQAVIAIENVRLFQELQDRNRELDRVARAADRHSGDPAGDQQFTDGCTAGPRYAVTERRGYAV